MAYQISGDVKSGLTPLARTVRAYNRSTGTLAGATASDGATGNFSMYVSSGSEHYVVALDAAENALIFDRVVPETVASLGLLDSYALNVNVAYSLRRLFSAYSGPLIRVRNSSNTELDIGFDLDGLLDVTTLTAHIGSGDGFVSTWYDQAGSANHMVQATASEQAKIATSGVVHSRIRFDGVDDTLASTSTVASSAAKSVYYTGVPLASAASASTPVLWQLTGTTPLIMSQNQPQGKSQPINQASAMLYGDLPSFDYARAFVVDAATGGSFSEQSTLRANGSNYAPSGGATATGNPIGGGAATLGGIPGQANYCPVHISSFVVYNVAHAAATIDAIEAQLNF